ncbi:hypothetical protein E2C01_091160 [Portunus trituberculatus]|uniref:Uncharacterized protein n=1 Tax=Portunus trituberculatus TaxID=210409 RepID=A0A5B7JD98_PORTR|nr:hypothetical protein [Portunus trituberculatus]
MKTLAVSRGVWAAWGGVERVSSHGSMSVAAGRRRRRPVTGGVLSGASGPVNQPRSAAEQRGPNRDISLHGPGAPPSLRLLPTNH